MEPEKVHEGRENFQVIDVREPKEWEAGRIEYAVHIPMQQIPNRLEDIEDGKKIVTVCRSGARSDDVARFLAAKGFEAENMDGGMKAWAKAGLPFGAPDGGPGRVA